MEECKWVVLKEDKGKWARKLRIMVVEENGRNNNGMKVIGRECEKGMKEETNKIGESIQTEVNT